MKTALLLVLGALMVTYVICADVLGPTTCCFNMYPRVIRATKIRSYIMTDERCARRGAIFYTKKNRTICVDPNHNWVQTIMKNLDENSF